MLVSKEDYENRGLAEPPHTDKRDNFFIIKGGKKREKRLKTLFFKAKPTTVDRNLRVRRIF